MFDLRQTLQSQDIGFLKIVAELWEIEMQAPETRRGLPEFIGKLLEPGRVSLVASRMPPDARGALADLVAHGGQLPWPLFTRRYGEVREMGPGRRDRERPDQQPASTTERLWYHALVGRAFSDTPEGPQEFAYIPTDILPWLDITAEGFHDGLGRKARPAEIQSRLPASDTILDHACSLLAGLRLGFSRQELEALAEAWQAAPGAPYPVPLQAHALQQLLEAAGLVDAQSQPVPEAARQFLEARRGEALALLVKAWLSSETFNELRLLPGLVFEGVWHNTPLLARQQIQAFAASGPAGEWRHLPALIEAVHAQHPDFQRPAGDYDSWYIRSQNTGEFLRGFENWWAVDGALVRFIIVGPMYWLGLLELAAPAEDQPPIAFRFSPWAERLLSGEDPGLAEEDEVVRIRSDAQFIVPRLAPRAVRYQLARFAAWDGFDRENYRYHLSAQTLARAVQQGLQTSHLIALLRRHAPALPPSLVKALERWNSHGTEARLERAVILRVRSPELLQVLRASRAARFLGDPLGPTVITVKPGAEDKVLAILAELGYLGDRELLS